MNDSGIIKCNLGVYKGQSALTYAMKSMSPEQQQDDLADRDRQARALAAAGMAAERFTMTQSYNVYKQGLQAPPILGPVQPIIEPEPTAINTIDGINWNMMDLGGPALDDMEMDFAKLFDPAHEAASLQSEGWPGSTDSALAPLSPYPDICINTHSPRSPTGV